MGPTNALPAICAVLVAFLTAYVLMRLFGSPPAQGRVSSLDGLRGYLAFFVFLHHASIWHNYVRTKVWGAPPSNLYAHFGQSSVAFFFMITAFLFFSKLIDGRTKKIDWLRMYVSRVLRLTPLYWLAMLALFSIVAAISQGILTDPWSTLVKNALCWLGFTILGTPDLNSVSASHIVSGVTWTLKYEWVFYGLLPLLALLVRPTPPFAYLILGLATLAMLHLVPRDVLAIGSFLSGIAAALLVRVHRFRQSSTGTAGALLAIGCVATAVTLFPTAYGLAPLLLLSLAFSVIAAGNSLFGILDHPVSRTLGELAYGIYLLHGIALFVTLTFVVGSDAAAGLSPTAYWALICCLTPPLIIASYGAFRFVERPAMQSTDAVTAWLRRGLRSRSAT